MPPASCGRCSMGHCLLSLRDAGWTRETHRTSQWKQAPFTSVGILLKDLKDLGFVESGPWLWLIPKKFRDLFRGDDSNLDLSTTSTLAGDVDLASEGIPREICVPEWNGYLESSHMRMPQVPLLSNLIFCIYRGLLSILSPDDGENYDAFLCTSVKPLENRIQKMVTHQYPHTFPLYPWCHYNMMDWFLESQGSMMKCSCLMDYGYCIFFIHSHMFGWLKLVKIPKKIQVAV